MVVVESCLVEQHADAAINVGLEGGLCILGDQYIKGKHISRSSRSIFHLASLCVCCLNTSRAHSLGLALGLRAKHETASLFAVGSG